MRGIGLGNDGDNNGERQDGRKTRGYGRNKKTIVFSNFMSGSIEQSLGGNLGNFSELGNIEETVGMSGSTKENVKDVNIFFDSPIGTLGKTLGCIGKTSSSIKKKLWGIFVFSEGQKIDT